MICLRRLLSKLWSLFHNARVEEELEREITAHLALLEYAFAEIVQHQEARNTA